jgi:tungstate transport system substrate-binding protein
MIRFFATLAIVFLMVSQTSATESVKTFRLAVTTSFENSGLSKFMLPKFTADTGYKVELIVVGTGRALDLGRRGDVDAVLVHAKSDELVFVADGYGSDRQEVMYNDFVIAGPKEDPAKVRDSEEVIDVLLKIQTNKVLFTSRGDNSGTHKKEISLWTLAGVDAKTLDTAWYRQTGSGMGAALNTAAAMDAYILVDRGTWLSFKNRQNLELLFQGDPPLHNQYGIIVINKQRFPHVNARGAEALRDWLTSAKGQTVNGSYRLHGEQLFHPNFKPSS